MCLAGAMKATKSLLLGSQSAVDLLLIMPTPRCSHALAAELGG